VSKVGRFGWSFEITIEESDWRFWLIQIIIWFIWSDVKLYFNITFIFKVFHKFSQANFTESFTIWLGFLSKLCKSNTFLQALDGFEQIWFWASIWSKGFMKPSWKISAWKSFDYWLIIWRFSSSICCLVTIRVGIIVFIRSFRNFWDSLRSPWHI